MVSDPRHRNKLLDASSIESYKRGYAQGLGKALEDVDSGAIETVCGVLERTTREGGRIYVVGNGGSAAIADHLCCDWTKGTSCKGHSTLKTHSLSANVALYSAIANDYGFERVFSTQVEFFGNKNDVLIAISSSGNSQNILEAVAMARSVGMHVVGFSGFSGGKLAQICDTSIHVSVDNYGIVEDVHQSVMHIIAQYLAYHRDRAAMA